MYTLLTGATGLVGRYLTRDLLLSGHQLAVVVRPSRRSAARDRMEEILQHWERELGRPLPRPVVLAGDITEPGFGLSPEDQAWIGSHCNTIIHSAAILEFYGKDRHGEPWRTNLNGTINMIDLCRQLNIRDIHYVSTAYVAGLQTERISEDSLEAGQEFRNDYEHSKYEAEQKVRAIDFAEHVTIYRPAVISGDSITGYTNTYHGIYLYLRLMSLMIPTIPMGPDGYRHTPIRLRMTGDERRNIIPVEWVSAVMTRLFETPEARGLTFHMAPDHPLSSRDMVKDCGDYFNSKGALFCGTDPDAIPAVSRDDDEDQWMFERMVTENMGTYAPYEITDNVFDMTNTKRFAGDIVCPLIDRTVLHRYLDYGNEDRWGKRKPEPADVAYWVEDAIQAAVSGASPLNGAAPTLKIGIDVSGAGGAQLTLSLSGQGIVAVERGIKGDDLPTLHVTSEDFAVLLQQQRAISQDGLAWENIGAHNPQELLELLTAGLQPVATAHQT